VEDKERELWIETNKQVDRDQTGSDVLRIHPCNSAKLGYLPMMTVTTLGALNAESFCERVLSCLKLVVSDNLHVSLKVEEIHTCHPPDESRVHGVHEGELPGHSIVGIQNN
jgi:hypothetical protein